MLRWLSLHFLKFTASHLASYVATSVCRLKAIAGLQRSSHRVPGLWG